MADEVCRVCCKEGAKRCSRCKLQFYCSKKCQQSDWKNHKALCNELNQVSLSLAKDVCSVCSKEGAKRCSKCRVQYCCSKECQQNDWKNHKSVCKLHQTSLNQIQNVCSICAKEGAKRCTKCRVQFYCSKECQQSDWKNHKVLCNELNQVSLSLAQDVCSVCSKGGAKRCSGCKLQFYCSKECQQNDWKNHKTVCKLHQTSLNQIQNVCSICAKEGAKRCTKCKAQFYCSKECQQKDWKNHKVLCNELNQMSMSLAKDVCSVCSREGARRCSRCKLKYYCSRECQNKDWKSHKAICEEIQKAVEFKRSSGSLPDLPSKFLEEETLKESVSQFLSILSNSGGLTFVPEYHKEYQRVYPNDKTSYEILRHSWIVAKTHDESVFGDFIIDSSREYGSDDMMKRWQCSGPALEEFLRSDPKPGDIFIDRIPKLYGDITSVGVDHGDVTPVIINQTLKNSPVPPMEFHFGITYVFLGFVDLFSLLVGSFRSDSAASQQGPLSFVGYDKSEVVIARAIVIYEMMVNRFCSTSILQVWFSSAWNEKTQEDFQKICSYLLNTKELETDERVKKMLNHWMVS